MVSQEKTSDKRFSINIIVEIPQWSNANNYLIHEELKSR